MKRLILFGLVALGYTFVSCEPEGDHQIHPAPAYAPLHEEYSEKAPAEKALAEEVNNDIQNE
jgi:hypothetical protein